MNNEQLELALLERMKEMHKMRKLELELIEQFDYAFNWVLKVSAQNGTTLPNYNAMKSCLIRIMNLIDDIYPSPEVKRSHFSPEDETEPLYILIATACCFLRFKQ
jgi:hypothetical protein